MLDFLLVEKLQCFRIFLSTVKCNFQLKRIIYGAARCQHSESRVRNGQWSDRQLFVLGERKAAACLAATCMHTIISSIYREGGTCIKRTANFLPAAFVVSLSPVRRAGEFVYIFRDAFMLNAFNGLLE